MEQADAAIPGGRLEIVRLRTNLVSRLRLEGVRLLDDEQRALVTLRAIDLELRPMALLRRRVEIDHLLVEGPTVALAADDEGGIDLLKVLGIEAGEEEDGSRGPWGGLPLPLRCGRLELSQGTFRFRPAEGDDVTVRDIGLRLALAGEGRRVDVEDLALEARLEAPRAVDLGLDADARYDNGALSLTALEARAGATWVRLGGTVARVETAPALALSLDAAHLVPADLAAWTGSDLLGRDLDLAGEVKGPLDGLRAQLALSPAGDAGADLLLEADLLADPLAWSLVLESAGLDLRSRLVPVTEPLTLAGRYAVEGEGTAWPGGIRARASLACGPQVVWGEQVESLEAEATFEAGRVTVASLSAGHALGRVSGSGTVDVVGGRADLAADLALSSLAGLRRYGIADLGGSATYRGRVEVDWSGADPAVHLDGVASGRGLDLPGLHLASAAVPLEASLRGAAVEAHGSAEASGLDAEQLSLAGLKGEWAASWSKLEGLDLQSDLGIAGLSLGEGAVRVERVGGTTRVGLPPEGSPGGSADLVVSDLLLGPRGYRAQGGEVAVELNDDGLVASFDLARNDAPFFRGRVAGNLLEQRWRIDDLLIAATEREPFEAEGPVVFRLADGGARELELALHGSAGQLRLTGDLVASPRPGDRLDVDLEQLDLVWVAGVVRLVAGDPEGPGPLDGLAGELNLHAQVQGLDGALATHTTLGVAGLAYPGLVRDLDVTAQVDGPLALPRVGLVLAGPSGRLLHATGQVPLVLGAGATGLDCAGDVDLRMLLPPGTLARFAQVSTALPELPGEASGQLVLAGPACDPDLGIGGTANLPLGAHGEIVRVDLDVARRGDRVVAAGELEQELVRWLRFDGGARTGLGQAMGWALAGGERPDLARWSLWADDIDLNIVPLAIPVQDLTAFADLRAGASGRLSGGVNLSGSPEGPTVQGGLLWVEGRMGEIPIQVATIGVEPIEGGYTVSAMVGIGLADGRSGQLVLAGFVPVTLALEGGGVDLGQEGLVLDLVGSELPLALLAGAVEGVSDVDGTASVRASVRGSIADPVLDGQLGVDGARLTLAEAGVRYEQGTLAATFDNERLSVEQLRVATRPRWLGGRAKEGWFQARGTVGLEAFAPRQVDFDLDADQVWLLHTTDTQLAVNGKVRVAGAWPSLTLTGDVQLAEGRFVLGESAFLDSSDLQLDRTIRVHRDGSALAAATRPTEPAVWEAFEVELGIDLQRNLKLIADVPMEDRFGSQFASLATLGLDAELDGPDLQFQLRSGQPVLHGGVEIVKGDLDMFGVGFDIAEGSTLAFAGDDYTNPIIDIEAEHSAGRYGAVRVKLQGPVSNLEPEISADEYPDQTDAVSLLLFGRPASEMSTSEGDTGGALLQAALGGMRGAVGRAVGGSMMGNVEFESDMVRLGMPLSDKLFLAYELRTIRTDEDENVNQWVLEWLIRRRMHAEFLTGDAGNSSADLYWRWIF